VTSIDAARELATSNHRFSTCPPHAKECPFLVGAITGKLGIFAHQATLLTSETHFAVSSGSLLLSSPGLFSISSASAASGHSA